jgi:hypothetical protein
MHGPAIVSTPPSPKQAATFTLPKRERERHWVGRDEERHVDMECVCVRERKRERGVWWERRHTEICEGRVKVS